jgi:hypothetical protein
LYLDDLGDAADAHGEIEAGDLTDLEFEAVANLRAEAACLRLQVVEGGWQRGEDVEAGVIGPHVPGLVGGRIREGDKGSGDW